MTVPRASVMPMTATPLPPSMPGERRAGAVLQGFVLAAGLWVILLSAACVPLSHVGGWRPQLVWPLAAVLAVVAGLLVRRVPAIGMPRWSAALMLAVAAGYGLWVGATHGEQVLPRRDAGSNVQAVVSLAATGARTVWLDPAAYGGSAVLTSPGVTLASPAFYAVGPPEEPGIQPQFVIGPAAVYSLGVFAGGPRGALLLPGLFAAVAVLAIGLLTARRVGPRWASLGAAGTALLYPLLHTARSAYSEPLALLTLGAGLLALTVAHAVGDSQGTRGGRTALLAGILIGGTVLVRIDGIREAILLIPLIGLLIARGMRWPHWLTLGLVGSVVAALGAALLQSYRYLGDIADSLVPLIALGGLLAALTWGILAWSDRGWTLPTRAATALPGVLAGLVVLTGGYLASRPLWLVVRQSAQDPGSRYVAGMQARQGLPVDGGRTYAEHSVAWLAWYVGPVALVVALAALTVLAYRAGAAWRDQKDLPAWTGPLLVAAGSTVLTLQRPGITPDQPWASRRLLIALLLVVVLVVAATAYVTRWVGRRLPSGYAVLAALAVLGSFVVPTALATAPHAGERVEQGSLAAVARVCSAFAPGDVALMVDSRAANEWPQVLRGQCGVPALSATTAVRRDPNELLRLVGSLSTTMTRGGRHLVVVAAESADNIAQLGIIPTPAVQRTVLEEAHLLTRRPDALVPLEISVWTGRP